MSEQPILIAGGGIAGLAASLALGTSGREVVVFEQAREFSEIGAGLQLGPNAARALKALGAWEAVAARAFSPPTIIIHDGLSGRILRRLELGAPFERRFGEPYRVIHRADLLAGLVESARTQIKIDLRPGVRVEGVRSSAASIVAAGVKGTALIGADGTRSAIRECLLHDGPPAAFPDTHYRALTEIAAGDQDAVCLWLYPRGHVVHYPVRAGRMLNIVATTVETIPDLGWSARASATHVKDYFSRAAPALGELLARPQAWSRWQAMVRPVGGDLPGGPVTLAGDALGPTLPYLAQGAALALEDAVVLGRCLDRHSTPQRAFRAYEALRRPRHAQIAAASRRLAWIYHATGPARHLRNAAIRANGSERFLDRMAWIYAYDPGRS